MGFFTMLSGSDEKAAEVNAAATHRERTHMRVPRVQADTDNLHAKMTLRAPIEPASVMNTSRSAEPKPSLTHSVALPAKRDRLSLWSRLLCRPEVYDPYVEAAPLTHLLDVNESHVLRKGVERQDAQQHAHAEGCAKDERNVLQSRRSGCTSGGEGSCLYTPAPNRDEEQRDGSEGSVMSACIVNASSVEEFEDVDRKSDVVEPNTGEPLLHTHVFHVFDTRRCRVPTSTLLWSPTLTDNFSINALVSGGGSAASMDATEIGAVSSRGSVPSTEPRLISGEELTKKRLQRRQQLKNAAKRDREYKEAWAALVASAGLHRAGDLEDETCRRTELRSSEERGSRCSSTVGASATPVVTSSYLTHEALESLRKGTQPLSYDIPETHLSRLSHYAQLPKKAKDVDEEAATVSEEKDCAGSCSSCSSTDSSQFALDDEHVNVETGLPLMYGSSLRCRNFASRTGEVSGERAPYRPHRRENDGRGGSQRIPAGKYLLGSRAYVDHVMFAQRRQQECALFALLTEAHRQAREAHRRLAQLYYYYIIPILAQYSAEHEIRGLERSLLQCGSGALRLYHQKFCRTVVYRGSESKTSPSSGASDSSACCLQVQPVDYQVTDYLFENVWRELFLDVKAYLGMQPCEDDDFGTSRTVSEQCHGAADLSGTASTCHGSVCVAATVLHSMELFERQRHIQSAARDAEEWVAWYYYYFIPQMQCAGSAEQKVALQRSLLPPPPSPSASVCETGSNDNGEGSHNHDNDSEPPQLHTIDSEYLPLHWTRACNTEEGEKVLNYRRHLKLKAIEGFLKQRSVVLGHSGEHSAVDDRGTANKTHASPSTTVNIVESTYEKVGGNATAASSDSYPLKHLSESRDFLGSVHKTECRQLLHVHAEADVEEASFLKPSLHGLSAVAIRRQKCGGGQVNDVGSEETEDDDDAIPVGAHHTVNVGCFGLSFFSIFD
ncbi:hypothetical protein, conserved [Leishmania tarentolae]|uniref:Uncharacterized protein n=1 Tax=Leishmania tarentolae TaxID=5689 RepID=A0A640KMZ5_LEITA|nr:hypothetical protein, conserved [Leishmania tarentolae]